MLISKDAAETLIDSPAKLKVLQQLMLGGVLTQSKIAHYTRLSDVHVARILEEYERFHLAQSKRVGRANLWEIQKQSYAYTSLLPVLHALQQISSPQKALKTLLTKELRSSLVERAILFGSVVDGNEAEESDIDLCIVLQKGKRKRDKKVEKMTQQMIVHCYEQFGKRLSIHLFSSSEWKEKQNTSFGKSILKGEVMVS